MRCAITGHLRWILGACWGACVIAHLFWPSLVLQHRKRKKSEESHRNLYSCMCKCFSVNFGMFSAYPYRTSCHIFHVCRLTIMQGKIVMTFKWDKVFKNGPSRICGRQFLKNFTWSILEYFVLNVAAVIKLISYALMKYDIPKLSICFFLACCLLLTWWLAVRKYIYILHSLKLFILEIV